MSCSCKVKRTNKNFNTDTVKHVRRDNSDDEDLQIYTGWGTLPDCLRCSLQVLIEGMSDDAPIHECESEIDHYTGHYVPYSLRRVCGFFNVPQIYYMCKGL